MLGLLSPASVSLLQLAEATQELVTLQQASASHITASDAQLATLQGQLAGREQHISALSEKLSEAEAKDQHIADQQAQILELRAEVQQLEKSVKETLQRMAGQQSGVKLLESRAAEAEGQLAEADRQAALQAEVGTLVSAYRQPGMQVEHRRHGTYILLAISLYPL